MRVEDFPLVGGIGSELLKDAARGQVFLVIEKTPLPAVAAGGHDAIHFNRLSGEIFRPRMPGVLTITSPRTEADDSCRLANRSHGLGQHCARFACPHIR